MDTPSRRAFFAAALLALAAVDARASVALRIQNSSAREVFVEVENPGALDTVGQSFGPVFPATYSAAGGVGTLVISATAHEAMFSGFIPAPVPGSFTPIVIEIDLATRSLCSYLPMFCGKTCSFVSGSAYDPVMGKVNLVGTQTQSGCDGGICRGPFTYFSERGDLRLREPFAPEAPALGPFGVALLLAALLAAAYAASRRATKRA